MWNDARHTVLHVSVGAAHQYVAAATPNILTLVVFLRRPPTSVLFPPQQHARCPQLDKDANRNYNSGHGFVCFVGVKAPDSQSPPVSSPVLASASLHPDSST